MNNIQIAHLIVKALNRNALYRQYRLDNRNKMLVRLSLLPGTPSIHYTGGPISSLVEPIPSYTGGPIAIGRAVQILKPILNDPSKCFEALAKEPPTGKIAITLKYVLEHGV